MKLTENYSLKGFNTFGIETSARWFASFSSADELREITSSSVYNTSPSLLIGRGSNLLFLDNYPGLVLHSNQQKVRVVEHDNRSVLLEAGAGMLWDDLVAYAVRNNWWGIENLSLIPGEVGAAAVQNIGAYGVEFCDVIDSVHVMNLSTGQELKLSVSDCGYGYRTSIFKTSARGVFAVLSVRLRLSRIAEPCFTYPHLEEEVLRRGKSDLATIRETIIAIRTAKLPDPELLGNAGSFFMNPVVSFEKWSQLSKEYPAMPHYRVTDNQVKIPAAWLIEQCGWKGRTIGNAGVYEHQPLVLVNRGGATGREIATLAAEIQHSVEERFGIALIPEVNYIG